jgi:hypothetical protein
VAKLYQYILRAKVRYPEHIRSDARDLINAILVPDPRKRCTLHDIMRHKWIADEVAELKLQHQPKSSEFNYSAPTLNDTDENDSSSANRNHHLAKLTLLLSPTSVLRSFITQRRPRASTCATSGRPNFDILDRGKSEAGGMKSADAVENMATYSNSGTSPISTSPRTRSTSAAHSAAAQLFESSIGAAMNNLMDKRRFFSVGRSLSSSSDSASSSSSQQPKVFSGSVIDKRTVSAVHSPAELLEIIRNRLGAGNELQWKSLGGGNVAVNDCGKSPFQLDCTYQPPSPVLFDSEKETEIVGSEDGFFQKSLRTLSSSWKRFAALSNTEMNSKRSVQFVVQVCRVGGLNNVYCLQLRRIKGNAWQYKRLYESIIDSLGLSSVPKQ